MPSFPPHRSTSKDGLLFSYIWICCFLPDDPFVSLDATTTIPLSPSYFSHHVRLRDMVGPSNGREIHIEKKSLVPPLRLSLSESQNKRRRRPTVPLMATLGSATKVSLNRLMHHFAFVHHDRELCVCQWSFSTLCFYPQMDVPLVGLFFLECIIPLTAWIIFKTRLFIDLCLLLTSRYMLCYCLLFSYASFTL